MTKINNILRNILLVVLITIVVVPYSAKADETVSDTLNCDGKVYVKTYNQDTVFINAHSYDEIDKEDLVLNINTSVPFDRGAELDVDELNKCPKNNYYDKPENKSIEGIVYVRCLIGRSGKLLKAFVEMSTNEKLNRAALDSAAKANSWKPAVSNGKNVATWIPIPFEFKNDL